MGWLHHEPIPFSLNLKKYHKELLVRSLAHKLVKAALQLIRMSLETVTLVGQDVTVGKGETQL